MENEFKYETENERFLKAAEGLRKAAAQEMAKQAEKGYVEPEDYAVMGYLCNLLTESMNVVRNLEFRINELSEEVNKFKK